MESQIDTARPQMCGSHVSTINLIGWAWASLT